MDGWAVGRAWHAGAPSRFSYVALSRGLIWSQHLLGPGTRRHGLTLCPAQTLALQEARPSISSISGLFLRGFWGQRPLAALALFPWAPDESPSWVWLKGKWSLA